MARQEEELARRHAPTEMDWRFCINCGAFFHSLSRFNRRCRACQEEDRSYGTLADAPSIKKLKPKEQKSEEQ
jgi:hypothetical protein